MLWPITHRKIPWGNIHPPMSQGVRPELRPRHRPEVKLLMRALSTGAVLGVFLASLVFLSPQITTNHSQPSATQLAPEPSMPPAPVQWLDFEAKQQAQTIELHWATGYEVDCQSFQIERAIGTDSFEVIGKVPAHGSSSMLHEYRFQDHARPAADSGQIHYRLRQVGLQGNRSLSPMVDLTWKPPQTHPSEFWVKATPNPAYDTFQIQLHGQGKYQMEILTPGGQLVASHALRLTGAHSLAFDADQWEKGLYLIRVQGPRSRKTTGVWIR
jgi:hypothetical protein